MYFNKKQLIIIFGFTLASSALAESEPLTCSQVQGCGDCLANGCSWIGGGICIESCDMIADVACYSNETFPTNTSSQICKKAELDEEDLELCHSREGCSACMATIKSDGTSCKYYLDETGTDEAGGYCSTGGCNMVGCPLETCPTENPLEDDELFAGNGDDVIFDVEDSINNIDITLDDDSVDDDISTVPAISNSIPDTPMQRSWYRQCKQRKDCSSCLSPGSTCAWNGGSCRDSCEIADAPCKKLDWFDPFTSGEKICGAIEAEERNVARCGRESNCQDCTTRSMLDARGRPSGFCSWYSSGYCGTSGCDMWGNCGNSKVRKCPTPRKLGFFRGSN